MPKSSKVAAMNFELHPNLQSKIFITDLPLCRVLMEDERHYPWLFAVPRRSHIGKLMDLKPQDQQVLICELDLLQKLLWDLFNPTQINVAAIGNKTPQLHVHVIARQNDDPAWPGTVWDHPVRQPYAFEEKARLIQQLRTGLRPNY